MKPSGSNSVSRNSAILIICLSSLMAFVAPGAFTASSSTVSRESISEQAGKAQKKSPLAQAPNAQAAGAPKAPSAVTITATMTDNVTPNTTKVLPGSTINYTVVINSTGTTDAAAVAFNDVIDPNTTLVAGSVHASPVAANETYNWVGNTFLDSSARGLPSVLANDTISSSPDMIVLTTLAGAATTLGGTVSLASNGHFTYTPPLGRPNAMDGASVNDSFNYTVTNSVDPTLTATGTVTINLSGRVWYLQAGAAGDGRSGTPSGSPSAMSTAADKSTDIFYIFSNAGSLNGLFSLDNSQQLLGQGVNLIVNSITLFAAAAPTPTTTDSTGNGVTLGNGNSLSGFNIGNCSGTAILGTSVGTLTINTMTISTTGAGLDLTGVGAPTATISLTSLTSSGGAKNVNLVGLNGTIGLGSGALSGATGNAFDVSGTGNAIISYSGTIGNTAGRTVNVNGKNAGSVLLSGAVSGSGTGISLTGNTGAVISFTGGISLSTGANDAFTATGGGTVSATQNNTTIVNTLTTTTGTALNVANTTISGLGFVFRSITAGTGAGSAGVGISLNTTGSSGGLTVTGTGTAASGGTIQHKTGADGSTTSGIGIFLNNTSNVSLDRMQLNNFDNYAIRGLGVNGFTLSNSVVDAGAAPNTNGTSTAFDEGSISFGARAPSNTTGLTGTASITNSTIADGYEDNISIFNFAGTLNLTVNNCIIRDTGGGAAVGTNMGNDGLVVEGHLTATNNVEVKNSQFIANRGDHFNPTADDSANLNVQFGNNGANTLTGGAPDALGQSITIQTGVAWNGSGSAKVSNNSINNAVDTPININIGGTGTFNATVNNNTIGTSGVANSGTVGNKDAIRIVANGDKSVDGTPDGGTFNAAVTNNTIQQVSGNGIFVIARDGGTAVDPIALNVTITGNTLREPAPGNNAIRVEAGASSTPIPDTASLCIDIGNSTAALKNTVNGDWGAAIAADEIRLRHQFSGTCTFRLPGFPEFAGQTVPQYLTARNIGFPPATASATVAGGGAYTGGAACVQPPAAPTKEEANAGSSFIGQSIESSADKTIEPANTSDTNGSSNEAVRESTAIASSENRGSYQQRERLVSYADLRTNNLGNLQPFAPLTSNLDTAFPVFTGSDASRANLSFVNYPVITAAQKQSPDVPQTTVTQTIGALPAGKSVTIKFSVTVNNPPAAAQVSTQGTVSATGISNVLTDDPDTGTAGDPTVTLIDLTITWAGGTSTNWDTGSNWNTTLAPVAINDVSIPAAGVTNEPTISASSPSVTSLTIATGRTLTITGQTLNVAGNWTNNGALAGNGTVVFNGNNNTQTLAGSTTFNNLTINHAGTGNVTATGSTLAVSNLLRIQAGTFISSSTFKDVQIDSGATLQSDGSTMNVSGNWTNNGGIFTPASGTVVFNSTTAGQTIGGTATSQTFNIVQVNKSGQTLIVGGSTSTLNLNGALTLTAGTFDIGTAPTINISGNWTNNGGAFTQGNGIVVFNSTTAAQAINGSAATQTFNNLTVNKSGQTLSVSGSTTTLNINGTLTRSAGTFDAGTATTINVLGNWTSNGGTFTPGPGTVVFGGASAQTIGGTTATTFNNLTINNSSGVTLSAAVTVNGTLTLTLGVLTNGANLTLGNGATISRSGGSLTAAPSFGATVSVVYTGSSPITAGPEIPTSTTVLSNLTINDSGGVILNANATVNVLLTLTAGDLKTGPTGTEFTLTMPAAATSGPAVGATDVVGNVKRTGFVINGAALSFGNPFNSIKINTGTTTAPTDITVNLDKAVPVTPAPFAGAIARKYTITPTGGSGISATLRLHYLDSELNGNTEGPTLNLFRYDGTNWHKEGQTANDTANNWVEKNNVTQFSPWTMNSTVPTEATLESFNATGYAGGTLIEWRTGFEVDNLGFNLYRDEGGKRVSVNSQMVAGSALVAGSGVVMRAGQSYAWWDGATSKSGAQYWLESVDLNGQSAWHGPFFSKVIGGDAPARSNSSMLGRSEGAQAGLTLPVERAALPRAGAPGQITLQSGLAGQPAVKMWVKREGFYRVTANDLAQTGIDLRGDTRLLQLYADGQQIPINVIAEKDGLLSAIEFYGRGLDAAFTDQRVYWLVSGSQPGLRINQVKGAGQPTASQSFLYTAERRDRTIYFSALRNGERENFFGPVIAASPVDQSITLQHVDQSASGTATVEVALQGVTALPHKVWVYLNGAFAGEVSFDGQTGAVSRFNVAQSLLRSGDNQVRFVAQAGPSDISLVDYIRLSYWHSFTADDNALRMTAGGNQEVTIGGFTSGAIRVLDVTDPDSPQELGAKIEQQKTGFAVTVASPGAGERRLLATTDDQSGKPAKLAANQPSGWRTPAHGANLVMIAPREFFSSIEPLRALRIKQGLKVEIADIEDVFDEFSFGNKSPQAIKDFLQYAATSWKIKPGFVLLVGDASYDAKNYLGLGDSDLVPTRLIDTSLMETASDDWLTDFNADGIADLAIGRLAARTPAEASTMVRKIIGYELSEPLESMLLVADINNGFDFESASTQLRALIPGNLRVEQIYRGQVDDATAKSRLIDAITRGQKVVNYMGHGSVNLWSGSLLTNEDAGNLTNAERLPVFVMMTCLNGYFHDPSLDSLAESLLKAESGGAVAVWTSTGMTVPVEQSVLNKQLYQLLFTSGNAMTLGEATARAKAAVTDGDIRRTWVLLGDPTMRLK